MSSRLAKHSLLDFQDTLANYECVATKAIYARVRCVIIYVIVCVSEDARRWTRSSHDVRESDRRVMALLH